MYDPKDLLLENYWCVCDKETQKVYIKKLFVCFGEALESAKQLGDKWNDKYEINLFVLHPTVF